MESQIVFANYIFISQKQVGTKIRFPYHSFNWYKGRIWKIFCNIELKDKNEADRSNKSS